MVWTKTYPVNNRCAYQQMTATQGVPFNIYNKKEATKHQQDGW